MASTRVDLSIECELEQTGVTLSRIVSIGTGRYAAGSVTSSKIVFGRRVRPSWATIVGIALTPLLVGIPVLLFVRRDESWWVDVNSTHRLSYFHVKGDINPATLEEVLGAVKDLRLHQADNEYQAASLTDVVVIPNRGEPHNATIEQPAVVERSTGPSIQRPTSSEPTLMPRPETVINDMTYFTHTQPMLALDSGQCITVDGRLVIGRKPKPPVGWQDAVTFVVDDVELSVSATHAGIERTPIGVKVVDFDSTNGTKIIQSDGSSKSVREHPTIAPIGARIVLGNRSLQVIDGAAKP